MSRHVSLICALLAVNCAISSATPANDACSITYVTSVSARGCPLFVHRRGSSGHFLLEPAFCIADSASINNPITRYDPRTGENFIVFPLLITHESLLSEAKEKLSNMTGLSVESVSFMEVRITRVIARNEMSIGKVSASVFLEPGQTVGQLRVICQPVQCLLIRQSLQRRQLELFENILFYTKLRERACRSGEDRRSHLLAVAGGTTPMRFFGRDIYGLQPCQGLRHIRTFTVRNCRVRVHQRLDKKGHFVLEPLLCLSDKRSAVHFVHNEGSHSLKLRLIVRDEAMMDAVKVEMARMNLRSVEWMELKAARFQLDSHQHRWRVQYSLRLTADRTEAEMRILCDDWTECDKLRRALQWTPSVLWRHLVANVTSRMSDCVVRSRDIRVGVSMSAPDSHRDLDVDIGSNTSTVLSSASQQPKFVTRDSRTFVIIQQRRSGAVRFSRNWTEYERGFGDESDFWIGLSAIHALTSPVGVTLRVELQLLNSSNFHAEYSGFLVGDSSSNFRMTYRRMEMRSSSLEFDALNDHKNMPFSTYDRDTRSCSRTLGSGGWWFNACATAYPNGVYNQRSSNGTRNQRSSWNLDKGRAAALKTVRLMLQV